MGNEGEGRFEGEMGLNEVDQLGHRHEVNDILKIIEGRNLGIDICLLWILLLHIVYKDAALFFPMEYLSVNAANRRKD